MSTPSSFLDLPEVVWEQTALFLPAPDVLSLVQTCKRIHTASTGPSFWTTLLGGGTRSDDPKRDYLTMAYATHLPAVRWRASPFPVSASISSREGHVACELGSDLVCVTGGFTNDPSVYVWDASGKEIWSNAEIRPGVLPISVYGASLTPLNDGKRAVQFGGFMGGGYSGEISQVALLSVTRKEEEEEDDDDSDDVVTYSAQWEKPMKNPDAHDMRISGRAYHSATLVNDRYLVVIGGMKSDGSILGEAILDTHEWKWLPCSFTGGGRPKARFGHSTFLDAPRNRLVVFGGGNGSDLLRSGRDFNDVWELDMGDDGKWKTDLVASLPWKWKCVHADSLGQEDDDDDDSGEECAEEAEDMNGSDEDGKPSAVSAADSPVVTPKCPLTPLQSLCIGRCHNAVKTARDTVLFLFGSGRPSTNGVLAYDLSQDKFHQPNVGGPLPVPRFTGVAVSLQDGYVLCHGGFSSQRGTSLSDWVRLDLAPALKRLPTDRETMRSFPAVTERDVESNRLGRVQRGMHSTLAMLLSHLRGQDSDDDEDHMRLAQSVLGGMVVMNDFEDEDDDDDDGDYADDDEEDEDGMEDS